MKITALDIEKSLPANRAQIINILDFDSKRISILRTKKNKLHVYYDHNPFFLSIHNLKGYFKQYDDTNNTVGRAKNNQYSTIIFNSKYKKIMLTEILKKINKDIHKNYTRTKFETNDVLPLNILINIRNIVCIVRYQRIYINTCWYDELYEQVQVTDTVY